MAATDEERTLGLQRDYRNESTKPVGARPRRSIRLMRAPNPSQPGILCLTIGKEANFYAFYPIPCEIGGRGFAVHRLGLGSLYHVRVGEPCDCSCDCKGFLMHGHCKHVLGLLALSRAGLV